MTRDIYLSYLLLLFILQCCWERVESTHIRAAILHPGKNSTFDPFGDWAPTRTFPHVLLSATVPPDSVGAFLEISVDGEVVGRSGGIPSSMSLPMLAAGHHTIKTALRTGNDDEGGDTVGLEDEIHIEIEEEHEGDEESDRLADLGWSGANDSVLHNLLSTPSTSPLVNVAMGKPARQSSDLNGEAGAHLAVDGENTIMHESSPTTAKTSSGKSSWWEVDLEREYNIEVVDVYRDQELRKPHDYPEVVPGISLIGLKMEMFDESGNLAGTFTWNDEHRSMLSWSPQQPVPARRLRLSRETEEDSSLAIVEVEVFARVDGWQCEDTCDHGQCIQGRCICAPDYTGTHCSVPVFSRWRYLPPKNDWLELADIVPHSPLFADLYRDLYDVQHPSSCSVETTDVYFYPNAGLASTVNYVSGLLSMAFNRRRAMATTHMMQWCYTSDSCPSRDFSCHLDPWSNCTDRVAPLSPTESPIWLVQPFNVPYDFDQHFSQRPRKYRSLGVFWWRIVMIETIVRPSIVPEPKLQGVKAALELLGQRYIGLHFRQGDSCHTSWRTGKCLGNKNHLQEVAMIAARYGITHVFVATDDADLVANLPEIGERLQLKFVTLSEFDRSELSASTTWIEKRLEKNELPQTELAYYTLLDMLLLADADVLIGQFQSNLSRVSYAMSAARRKRFIPFVSLDGPWCMNWRMCCNMRFGGAADIC